ncbi:hypothetical protein J4526_05905 [Desulfurococcaceae archaeon MEX13E-LK6-19]|nr:hypothetical protein J4526_05905 [Desulfurococcaceae archaeon MEX13E-LK6-19]
MSSFLKPLICILVCITALLTSLYIYFTGSTIELYGIKLAIDTLSLFFIVNTCILGIACIWASHRYLELYKNTHPLIPYYGLMLIFILSMVVIPASRNWILFLFFWEIMTLSSYFLIIYDYADEKVLRTGWMYFVAMHILNALPLFLMVALIYMSTSSFDFTSYSKFCIYITLLALIGFATKAGLFPMHFWLPEAHPAAPSPVSALLSGAMVELGIYGIVRVFSLSAFPITPWITLVAYIMAFMNIVAALLTYPLQFDVKRLFAWSTIENSGWMMLIVLVSKDITDIALPLGLYVLCHGLAKAAAFLSSGGIIYVYGTRNLSEIKGMVNTCKPLAFLTIFSILALEGVPPFNLFLAKLYVVLKVFHYNNWLGGFLAIIWCFVFIVFLNIIHTFILSKGSPEAKRKLPLSISAPIIMLLILSMLSYPLVSLIMKGGVWKLW